MGRGQLFHACSFPARRITGESLNGPQRRQGSSLPTVSVGKPRPVPAEAGARRVLAEHPRGRAEERAGSGRGRRQRAGLRSAPPRRASAGGVCWGRAPSERSGTPALPVGRPAGRARGASGQLPALRDAGQGGWSRQTQGFPGGGGGGCHRRLGKRAEPRGRQKRFTSARFCSSGRKALGLTPAFPEGRAGWVVLRPVPACGGLPAISGRARRSSSSRGFSLGRCLRT